MEVQRTTYLGVIGLLGILIAATYVNPGAKLSPSILAPFRSAYEPFTTSGFAPSVDNLAARYQKGCPTHRFESVKIVSRDPSIMIIEDFLTPEEVQTLINAAYFPYPTSSSEMANMSNPLFSESTVLNYNSNPVEKSHRDSWTAYLSLPSDPEENDDHAVIKCIEERAAQFQGYVPVDNMENLQVVKYFTHSILHR